MLISSSGLKLDRSKSQRLQSGPLRVKYFTRDVTATAGADYTATTGYLTFLPGEKEENRPGAGAGG